MRSVKPLPGNVVRTRRRVHAIVIDDDPLSRRLAAAALRVIGVAPALEASNGQEALDRLRSHAAAIDVAICDLEMDGMDGVELLTRLHAEHPDIAIVLLSGIDRAVIQAVENMAKSLGLRVLGALGKPLDREQLAGLIARLNAAGDTVDRAPVFAGQISAPEVRAALAAHRIVPYFQPRISLLSGALVCCEALIRWKHPRHGLLGPRRFVPLARDAGLLIPITWHMIERCLAEARRWFDAGLDLSIAINIPIELLEQASVTENIVALAREHDVPLNQVILEIAEKSAAGFDSVMIGNLARLRLRGVRLAIDHFGTGYASMEQLLRVPFTDLAVDRSFVAGAVHNPNLRAILESSVNLGRRLGLYTIVEGLETGEELSILRKLPCDAAQGNLISPPIDGEALRHWAGAWQTAQPRPTVAQLATRNAA